MSHLKDYSDRRNKYWCIHCHRPLSVKTKTRDHVPSKSLLKSPLPNNLPVVNICLTCNNSYSRDEEYLMVFLKGVLLGTSDPQFVTDEKIKSILQKNISLKNRIEKSRIEILNSKGEKMIYWQPEIECISNVLLKNARGHVMYELGEPMFENPIVINIIPLMSMTGDLRDIFENDESVSAIWPEVGSRMMFRMIEGGLRSGSWINVQDDIYRYSVTMERGIRVRSVIHEYLASEIIWE